MRFNWFFSDLSLAAFLLAALEALAFFLIAEIFDLVAFIWRSKAPIPDTLFFAMNLNFWVIK